MNPAVAALIHASEQYGEQLRFFRLHHGPVHVELPSVEDRECDLVYAVIDLMVGRVQAACGRDLALSSGGLEATGTRVSWFYDSELCGNCHTVFGPHAHLIFDDNRHPDEHISCDPAKCDAAADAIRWTCPRCGAHCVCDELDPAPDLIGDI